MQGMPQPLVISVPHSLGKEEAVRRLKSGLATAQSQFRQFFTVQEEIWSGDRACISGSHIRADCKRHT